MVTEQRRVSIRAIVTLIIIGGFFAAYFLQPSDETMKGALIAAFAGAWGYWLGSSQGAQENREHMNRSHDAVIETVTEVAKRPH